MRRHDMVWITDDGLQFAREYVAQINPDVLSQDVAAVIVPDVPAIISRQQEADDRLWQVGFSSHLRRDGNRLRIAAAIPKTEIRAVTTPFEAAKTLCCRDSKEAAVVRELTALGKAVQLRVGIYGSLALGTLTGLPYFTDASDYDIWASPVGQTVDGTAFYRHVKAMEAVNEIRIDCEIDCDGYGVKLRELAAGSTTVLGKGLYDVGILKARTYKEFYFKRSF